MGFLSSSSTQILSLKDDDEGNKDSAHVTRGTLGLWTVNQLLEDGVWLPTTNESFAAPEEPARNTILRDTILKIAGINDVSAQTAVLKCLENPDAGDAERDSNRESASSGSDAESGSPGGYEDGASEYTRTNGSDGSDSEAEDKGEVSAGFGRAICHYCEKPALTKPGGR